MTYNVSSGTLSLYTTTTINKMWLVLPSLSSLLISFFSRWSCRLCIALCSSSDNWELPRWLGAQRSRTSMLPTQWCLHAAAFYDHLARRMCLCQVALSLSHCDVINQTLQHQISECNCPFISNVTNYRRCADIPCPTSLSVWHYLTLLVGPFDP